MIPLSDDDTVVPAGIVSAFDTALVAALAAEASEVTAARSSLDDTLAVVGCTERTDACMARVAQTLSVDRIVFGQVSGSGHANVYEVLVQIATDEESAPLEHRFQVRAVELADAESAFAMASPAWWLKSPPALAEQVSMKPAAAAEASPAGDETIGQTFDPELVESSTWVLAGTGGALLSAGVVFWLLASSAESDVAEAPVATAADLERLVDLEARARTRAGLGNALVVAGGLLGGVAVFMGLRQGLTEDSPELGIAPMGSGDSLGLTLRWTR